MSEFASAKYTAGQLNAMVKKIIKEAGEDGPERFLRDELTVSKPTRRWQEEDGVITLTLPPTDGTTGEQWITRTESKGNRVGDYTKQLLRFEDFKPTTGVIYTVKVLKGELFSDSDRYTSKIRAEAKKRKLQTPNAELACLIRENFSDEELKEMGLWWIIVMHEPIKDSDGDLRLLDVLQGDGGRWLGSCCGRPGRGWDREGGFAFAQGPQA